MKKDIKKSSYYVWFLGAEEAKGLRGSEYMIPVIRNLVEREKHIEPFKVTLQVSHKGLKIIQNVPLSSNINTNNANSGHTSKLLKTSSTSNSTAAGKTEVIKHFIPHHAVTSVFQLDDIVSCILLLYNPLTKCPVHVHAYRCDSIETAEILCGQLQILLERPENQKKLEEIESRLKAKGLIASSTNVVPSRHHLRTNGGGKPQQESSPSDCGRSSARESELSAGGGSSGSSDRCVNNESRIANLYDSLAAELKEKLNVAGQQKKQTPLLLPPRDYDTVHRQKGNLSGIDFRRCLNMNIVGVTAKNKTNKDNDNIRNNRHLSSANSSGAVIGKYAQTAAPTTTVTSKSPPVVGIVGLADRGPPREKLGSSGGSSGICSDHAPSPEQECDTSARFLDNQSSSDEEWNTEQAANGNSSLFLVQTSTALSSHHPNNDWKSKELSLPRARRHNSSGFESNPESPKIFPDQTPTMGIYKRAADEDRCQDSVIASQYKGKKSSPSNSFDLDRKQKLLDEIKIRKQKNCSSSPVDDFNNHKKRTPEGRQRSPSPGEIVSPKERFKDAKEKFRLLEKERLEEQEKLIQMNMDKKKIGHHPYPGGGLKSKLNKTGRFKDEDDFLLEDRIRYYHQQHQQQQHQQSDDYRTEMDSETKRRSLAKANNYHRNRSMESLNSEDYPSLASSSLNYNTNTNNNNNNNNNNSAYRNSENGGSRPSRMNSFPEEELSLPYNSRMSRYHSSEISIDPNRKRHDYQSAVISGGNGRTTASRSFSEDYLSDHHRVNDMSGSRYRDSDIRQNHHHHHHHHHHQQQSSVPFVEDTAIPLQRYRSPTRSSSRPGYNYHQQHPPPSAAAPPPPAVVKEEDDDDTKIRRGALVKRSDSRYHKSHELRRTAVVVPDTTEDEKKRHSNEIAKELKRRSYQDHRSANVSELSYPSAVNLNYHPSPRYYHHRGTIEESERDRYPTSSERADVPQTRAYHQQYGSSSNNINNNNNSNNIRNGRSSPNTTSSTSAIITNSNINGSVAPNSISPRYRHSYAEPFHHHAAPVTSLSHNHDLLHRTNSSLSSGRIGIAAVHHY